jgi:hypothetical protein
MTDPHPVDSELATFAEGAVTESTFIAEHVATCRTCAEIVSRLSAIHEDLPSFSARPETLGVPLSAARRLAEAGNPQPALGQLWRAAARPGEILLVWIRRLRSDGRLAVVPVTFDADYADEYSLVLDAEQSPLGVDLVFHTAVESTIDQRALLNSLGAVQLAAEIEAVRTARVRGDPVVGLNVGSPVASMADERIQYRQHLADALVEMTTARFEPDTTDLIDDDFSDVDPQDDSLDELLEDATIAQFVRQILNGLSSAHPTARLVPSSGLQVVQGSVRPIATVLHLDVFVGLVMTSTEVSADEFLELSRAMFHADLSLRAVCFTTDSPPFEARLIDRRVLVDAYETPMGRIAQHGTAITVGPVADVLVKYFDHVINPFRVVATGTVDVIAIDYRSIAVVVGAGAVRETAARASGYKIPGKADGYARVTSHRAAIVSIVEQALQGLDVNVAGLLDASQ